MIYVSNRGVGRWRARVLSVRDGIATMERWRPGHSRQPIEFALPLAFLESPACGWRKADRSVKGTGP